MGFGTIAKEFANRCLSPLNIRADSLTAERAELSRLNRLRDWGHFQTAVFPILKQFVRCEPTIVIEMVGRTEDQFALLVEKEQNGFRLNNAYFSTPDAEVLYAMVSHHKPQRVIEVGSGNSTRVIRSAIQNNALRTCVTSIDPYPRRDVTGISDEVISARVEDVNRPDLFTALEADDILFIDSSHEIAAGNDVALLFLTVLPRLPSGVIVHVHDVFLPFEYPEEWIIENRWPWTEQYLLQALLSGSDDFEVLWPGYFLQQTRPQLRAHFKRWESGSCAKSIWLKRV